MLRIMCRKKTLRAARPDLSSLFSSIIVLLLLTPAFAADKQKDEETLRNANMVLQDMINGNAISPALLSKAECVLILPGVKKVGFGVGGTGGRGPLLCRGGENFHGKWSAPAMFSIGGATRQGADTLSMQKAIDAAMKKLENPNASSN
jgi:lipid-binding SYLF domain-containing protein